MSDFVLPHWISKAVRYLGGRYFTQQWNKKPVGLRPGCEPFFCQVHMLTWCVVKAQYVPLGWVNE